MSENETSLARIDAVTRAVDSAESVQELKVIHDKISAMLPALKQLVKEGRLTFGEIFPLMVTKLKDERKAGGMLAGIERNRGGKGMPQIASLSGNDAIYTKVCEEADLNLNTAARWQLEALVLEDIFNELIAKAKEEGDTLTSHSLMVLGMRQIVVDTPEAPPLPEGIYNVFYADPPWQYGNPQHTKGDERRIGDQDTTLDTLYQTRTIEELCDFGKDIRPMVADNAVLFMWVTSPFLERGFQVVSAWGFDYKTSMVWDKVKHNVGYYVSVRHELLLICTKGSMLPENPVLFDSVQTIERTGHSVKPEFFYEVIETLYPNGKYIELFQRGEARAKWTIWGNEAIPFRRTDSEALMD